MSGVHITKAPIKYLGLCNSMSCQMMHILEAKVEPRDHDLFPWLLCVNTLAEPVLLFRLTSRLVFHPWPEHSPTLLTSPIIFTSSLFIGTRTARQGAKWTSSALFLNIFYSWKHRESHKVQLITKQIALFSLFHKVAV